MVLGRLDSVTSDISAQHSPSASPPARRATLTLRSAPEEPQEIMAGMPDAHLPADALDDIAYVRAAFRRLDGPAAELVERGVLPQATYVLPDGTPMVPETHAALLQDDPGGVAGRFRERFLAAGGAPADAEDELREWLGGGYGVCLRDPSPEAIVAKGALMTAIGALLAAPAPQDDSWRGALRGAVDALDALERPFAAHDRERFGGPVSRDRLITGPRERFPEVWS
jgi:hypothetical protein